MMMEESKKAGTTDGDQATVKSRHRSLSTATLIPIVMLLKATRILSQFTKTLDFLSHNCGKHGQPFFRKAQLFLY